VSSQLQTGDAAVDSHAHHRHVAPTTFTQTNLISDGSVPAQQTDPNLINPWGVSHSPTSPFWISDNGTGLTSIDSLVAGNVTLNVIPPVTIAPATPDGGPAAPTGQVFNSFASSDAFTLMDGKPATFLFATEDGTISGWNMAAGSESIIAVNESANPADGSEALGMGAVYKGLAIAQTDDGPMLYAANFRHGTVDMFDQNFDQVKSFTDPNVPTDFAPLTASWTSSTWRGICCTASLRAVRSTRLGVLPLHRTALASSPATCWSATSAAAPSMRST
jgi:uncharacterized protein (TIGR03118 family)